MNTGQLDRNNIIRNITARIGITIAICIYICGMLFDTLYR